MRCGADDETIVLCHYTGFRRHDFGGGFGIKVHDAVGAHLCAKCHELMDRTSRSKVSAIDHSEEFLHLCALTIIRLFDKGVVK